MEAIQKVVKKSLKNANLRKRSYWGDQEFCNFSVNVLAFTPGKTNYDIELVNTRETKVKNDTFCKKLYY